MSQTFKDLQEQSPEDFEKLKRAQRYEELGWYALYVTPLHERQILEAFTGQPDPYKRTGRSARSKVQPLENPIEAYVPIRIERRKWSDRIKEVPVVLTPGIVFVRIKLVDRRKLYINDNIRSFLYNKEKQEPVKISDIVMSEFRNAVEYGDNPTMIEPQKGDTVKIIGGKLEGYIGEIVRVDGAKKFQLRINDLMAVVVDIPANQVMRVPKGTPPEYKDERFL
ncbi:MAG: KOW motif-containing protein [Bacteroidales bacterium]|nr:KOW motif-containing protein [Bacteroidales bacterium]